MSKTKCLIVDDEAIAQRIIISYLNDLHDFEIVATCFNAMKAMTILEKEEINLIFLDIEMPKLSGISFLKTMQNPPSVIITSAHREYAIEGFELEVVDYLLKPIPFDRFIKAINKYKRHFNSKLLFAETPQNQETAFLYIKSDRKTYKLDMDVISHIEGMNNYIIIHVLGKKHIVYKSISDILEELTPQFIRIHKSYIINKSRIQSFSKELVDLGDVQLPIGKTYKEAVDEF